NPIFTATYTGFANGEDSSVVTGTLIGSTSATTNSPIGTYPITVSGQTASNYAINYLDGALTITSYALTVTVDNLSRSYGATNPVLTGSITGLQNGDNITVTYDVSAT